MAEPSVIRSVRFPIELYRRIEEEDRRRGGRSQNAIIVEAVEEYLTKQRSEDHNRQGG